MTPPALLPFVVSHHARVRFAERFPDHDLDAAVERATWISTDVMLWEVTQARSGFVIHPDTTYYHDALLNCLFCAKITADARLIATAFPYRRPAKRRPADFGRSQEDAA